MTPIKQAIILAAGQGHRLWPYTQDRPKCLLDIGGKTILEHQVHALLAQGIDRITVVTGYLGHMIRDVLGEQAQYITNQHYTETSSMYSLWLARGAALEGCLILNADVRGRRERGEGEKGGEGEGGKGGEGRGGGE